VSHDRSPPRVGALLPQRGKHFAQSPLGHAQLCRMQLISLKRVFEKAKITLWQGKTRWWPALPASDDP
jgi:hypothetical protein